MNFDNAATATLSLRLLETLIHFLWQGAALALLAALLLLVTRRAAARTRYAILLSIFALMAASPVLTFGLLPASPTPASEPASVPSISMAQAMPVAATPSEEVIAPPEAPTLSTVLFDDGVTGVGATEAPASGENVKALKPLALRDETPVIAPKETPMGVTEGDYSARKTPPQQVAASSAQEPAVQLFASTSSQSQQPLPTTEPALEAGTLAKTSGEPAHVVPPVITQTLATLDTYIRAHATALTLAYLLGVVLMLLRLAWALRGGRRLRRLGIAVTDSALLDVLREQARILGLRAAPAVAYCERVAVPTVVGILRPTILLPLFMVTGFTPDQLELILRHELAHIRRYDHLVNLVQRLVEAFLFFHPGVWYISRLIRIEREHCCDDLVLSTGGEALAYADSLVRIAEKGLGKESLAAVHMAARPSDLRRRIIRLLEGPAPHLRITRLGLTIALMLLIGTGAALHAASRDTSEAEPPALAQDDPSDPSDPSDLPSLSTSEHPTLEEFSQLIEKLEDVERKLGELTQKLDQAERPVPLVPEPAPHPGTQAYPPVLEQAPIAPAPEPPLETFPGPRVPDADIDDLAPLTEEVRSQLNIPDFDINMLQPRSESRPDARAIINLKSVTIGETIPDTPLTLLAVEVNRIAVKHDPTGQKFVLPFGYPAEMQRVDEPHLADTSVSSIDSVPSVPSAPFDLISQLQDEDWWLRKIAAQQMGEIQNPNVGMLINALKDEDPHVQAAAAESLGKIGNDRAIKHLVAALKEEDPVRTAAAEALANFDTAQTLDLIKLAAADTENLDVQIGAVAALKHIAPDIAVPILVDTLKTVRPGDAIVSNAIHDVLSQVPPDAAIGAVTELAQSGSGVASANAARVLAAWDTQAAHEALIQTATNPDSAARAIAIEFLADIPGDAITQTLVNLLDDSAWDIRVAAAKALEKRSYFPQTPEAQAKYYVPLEKWDAVSSLGNAAVEPLIAALDAPESEDNPRRVPPSERFHDKDGLRFIRPSQVRMPTQPAMMLARLGATDASMNIAELLKRESSETRQDAAAALQILNDPRALPALLDAMRDPNPGVRYNVLQALRRLNTPEAVDPIVTALNDPDAGIRSAAAQALGELKVEAALEPLVHALGDVTEEVQVEAMTALGQIGDPAAIEPVAAFLAPDKPEGWHRLAAETLGKLGPQAIPHLEAYLNRPASKPESPTAYTPRPPGLDPQQAVNDALAMLKQMQQEDSSTEP